MSKPETPGGIWGDEPSPEDVFAGNTPRYSVVLTEANEAKRVSCLKGVRAVMSKLSGAPVDVFTADAMWTRFLEGERPLVIGYATTMAGAKEAAEAGVEASVKNISVGYGLTPEEIAEYAEAAKGRPEAENEAPQYPDQSDREAGIRPLIGNDLVLTPEELSFEPFDPSAEGAKTALVLMNMTGGDAGRSIVWAKLLRRATADNLYDEVVAILLGSVPVVWRPE